jgi:predicted Zn-ribbon and HTH transcriptional regulator
MVRGDILCGMAKVTLTVEGYRCERCGHEWVPRDKEQDPTVCPKCKSPYWNKPRRDAEALKEARKGKKEPRK